MIRNKVIKGFLIGLLVSATANLITFGNIEIINVLVGGITGIIFYHLFHVKNV